MALTNVAFIGDLHFNMKNYKEMHKSLSLAVDACIENDVHLIVQLGDVFDFYNISSGRTSVATIVNAVKEPLDRAVRSGMEVIILEGNHDASSPGLQGEFYRSSIHLLSDDSIGTYSDPCIVPYRDLDICVVPWLTETRRGMLDAVRDEFRKHDRFGILVGHFTAEGTAINNVYLEKNTGEFLLTHEELEKFNADLIVAGHIHKREGFYPGLLMHQNLNDVGTPTGFRIVSIDDGKIINDRFVDLKTPRYHLIELDSSEPVDILKSIEDINDFDQYVVRIKDKRLGQVTVPENVKLEYKPIVSATTRLEMHREEAFKMSMIEAWTMWANRNEYSKEVIERATQLMVAEGLT